MNCYIVIIGSANLTDGALLRTFAGAFHFPVEARVSND